MPQAWGTTHLDVYNGGQPTNRVWLSGPITEEGEDGSFSFELESLICHARFDDGRMDYRVEKQEDDGRFKWEVVEWSIDMDGNDSREPYRVREGVEDTFEEARAHMGGLINDPDHMEIIGHGRGEHYTDAEIEEYGRQEDAAVQARIEEMRAEGAEGDDDELRAEAKRWWWSKDDDKESEISY